MEERLNKFLANNGVCSRRKADEYIESGRVSINGVVVTELGTKVTEKDKVWVDGKEITDDSQKMYVKLNKPTGVVSTAKEQFGRQCVTDLVDAKVRLYPVGRLDMYSEGLILLTNDGEFANRITHPRSHVSKTYEVTLTQEVLDEDIEKLKSGVDIGGYVTKKAEVTRLDENVLKIVIYEGKNRQIRKMCEVTGYKVKKLKRIKIGELELGNLKIGKYEFLSMDDIEKIFK